MICLPTGLPVYTSVGLFEMLAGLRIVWVAASSSLVVSLLVKMRD